MNKKLVLERMQKINFEPDVFIHFTHQLKLSLWESYQSKHISDIMLKRIRLCRKIKKEKKHFKYFPLTFWNIYRRSLLQSAKVNLCSILLYVPLFSALLLVFQLPSLCLVQLYFFAVQVSGLPVTCCWTARFLCGSPGLHWQNSSFHSKKQLYD